ncbi:Rrp15p-domain-containing protein [Butyriboletus roseoflavus]|nr:Rrp15p-domain-containing protein [Butyriboletus roseoflavus]
MSTNKRVKLAEGREDKFVTSSDDLQLSGSSESSRNTDDDSEINGQRMKSKKTLKRKRRATEPLQFGATLQSLLNTDAPSGLPLSLKPSVLHQKNDVKLEVEARKVIQIERREREERGRTRDVIGGWGGESERSLRKVAQRGVVQLFNAIQQSQLAAAAAEEEAKVSRGTGKPSLPTPSLSRKDKGKKNNHKTNIPARGGKQSAADKDTFFDMIRSGGIASKVNGRCYTALDFGAPKDPALNLGVCCQKEPALGSTW